VTQTWDRITALFGAARLLDTSERMAFLDAACSHDAALRDEVERLLTDAAKDDTFLDEPIWAGLVSALPATSLTSGEVLKNRYRIEAPVASGGQAFVYRATDTVLSRKVIVKVMRGSGSQNLSIKARFEQEMTALSRIDHPGVVGILDVGELPGGYPFLVIQFVNGTSLRQELQNGPLEIHRAARLLRNLGSALGAAHAAGVVHQDLKPENIMLQRSEDGTDTLKLIDFGICKVERSGLQRGVTSVTIAGTIRYMAPEQFHGEHSPACDTYALALVACEMLCGHPESRALPKSTDVETRTLIESALAFRPEDRPGDVQHWCEQLANALVKEHKARGRALGVAAALTAAAAAVTLGSWYLPRSATEPRRIIEKVGAFDPLAEGFLVHNEITGTVADNPQRNGFDGWRVFTGRQGHYFKNLTTEEKRRALDHGWRLTSVMRLEEGRCFTVVDFAGVGRRFDIDVDRVTGHDRVRLQTQIVPSLEGLDWTPAATDDAYHIYDLRYDPAALSADLWVDGAKRLTGYRGHSQFQQDGDLLFGVAVFESTRAVASFQDVRFEINP
jgi:tRNA A-37 threonylcarbamoyl transferase component Bud32